MQSEKGKQSNEKVSDRKNVNARVISMRAWKTRKRIHSVRGNRSWSRSAVTFITILCAIAAGVFALASCVPFQGQVKAIVLAWFIGLIGMSMSLVLHVWRDRVAKRLLTLCMCSLAISFVAALSKWMTTPH